MRFGGEITIVDEKTGDTKVSKVDMDKPEGSRTSVNPKASQIMTAHVKKVLKGGYEELPYNKRSSSRL